VYLILVSLALVAKAYILLIAGRQKGDTQYFLGLSAVMAGLNLCELLIYIASLNGSASEYLLRTYYAVTFLGVSAMVLYASYVIGQRSKKYLLLALIINALVGTLFLATDLIIAGSAPLGYAVTAITGDYYYIFRILILAGFLTTVSLLIIGLFKAKSRVQKNRCMTILLSYSPIILGATYVIVSMWFGATQNAAGVVPVATTLFLLLVLKYENEHRLTDIRTVLPFSMEKETVQGIKSAFSKYSMCEAHHKETLAEIEKLLVIYKHSKARQEQSVSELAREMGLKRPTLYSIYKRLNLNHLLKDNK